MKTDAMTGSEPLPEEKPEAGQLLPAQPAEVQKHKKQKAPKTVARADVAAPKLDPARNIEITVIVPIQTGDGRVRDVVEACGFELERLGRNWECILVFDGVRGPAWEHAQSLAREKPGRVHPIAFQQPAGESTCLTAAF